MGYRYFIGISPPDPLYSQVVNFQLGRPCALVEPHITVKAQSGLIDPPTWLKNIWTICLATKPFPVVVNEVEHFGGDVVYLKVESPGLVELHRSFVRAIGPTPEEIMDFHEMEGFIPHITLSQSMPEQGIADVGSVIESAKVKFKSPSRFICGADKRRRSVTGWPKSRRRSSLPFEMGAASPGTIRSA